MKATVLIAVVAVLAVATLALRPKHYELDGYNYERYVADFHKPYAAGSGEYAQREALFNARLRAVQEHNAAGTSSYKKGVNHMSDWTDAERKALNGARPREMLNVRPKSAPVPVRKAGDVLPESVDWRKYTPQVLSAVKDQGQCGSCWAHGSTEQMETFFAIKTGDLYVLSQQQVTSCAPNPNDCGGTGGCMGSIAQLAYQYVQEAHGITEEWQYSYSSYLGDTGACKPQSYKTVVANVSAHVTLPTNNYDDVMNALANIGPLAVNVEADYWFEYETGVYDDNPYYTRNITIDHVVQLIGYGHDATLGKDYWLVRNSWSAGFGEAGYIRLLRNATAACGWDVDPQMGTGCNGGPPQLRACGMCGILLDSSYPFME